jgi:hypothetical protein
MSNESYLTHVPENTSQLQATKFTFVIPELPFARYFCQTVILPGVSTTPVTVQNPNVSIKLHGDKLIYGDLILTFLIDEDLRVWEETYNWIKALLRPVSTQQYGIRNGQKMPNYYDGELTINSNANIPNLRIKFASCHPTDLSGITFNTTETGDPTITASVTFAYDYFEIERI